MTTDELAPYMGLPCHVRLRCRGCRGTHILQATPMWGRYAGQLLLHGYVFNSEDVERVWQQAKPPRRKRDVGVWLRRVPCFATHSRARTTGSV